MLSRMERNKKLHEQVAKENMMKRQRLDSNSLIYATFEKIKAFDQGDYFKKKIQDFDKKYETEKPYIDKDRSKNPISDKFLQEIKDFAEQVNAIKDSSSVDKNSKKQLVEEEQFNNKKYKNLVDNLSASQNAFIDEIKKNNQSKKTEKIFWTEVEALEEIKNKDDNFAQINLRVNKKSEEYLNEVRRNWKNSKIGLKNRSLIIILSVTTIIAIIALVGLILYIFY